MKTYKLVLHTVKIWKLGVINNQLHMALVSLIHSFMQRWASRLSHFRLVSVLDRNDNKCGPKALWSHNPSTTKKHSNNEIIINKQRNKNKSGPMALWSHTPAQQQKHSSKEEYHQEIEVAPRYKVLLLLTQLTPRAYTAYTAWVYCLHCFREKELLLCLWNTYNIAI